MKSLVVGTAGHIDHGKSSLVLALTGTDPDRLKEEKARGITIDLGFAHARVGEHDVAFVDVPGHERFVKNMLAGVGGIDAVMLVIAADESVMPQTREHFAICRLLEIPAGVIVLTKTDLADADTLEVARGEARELVAGSRIADAPIVAVSSRTGEGLDDLRQALAAMVAAQPGRAGDGSPRLPVDRVFSMRGFGTVVTGTLTSGTLGVDDDLVLLPGGRPVKVRGVQVHGAQQPSAAAGRRVALNLSGVDLADVARGQTLTRPGAFEETRRFDAVIELLPDAPPLRHGARVRFHQGTSELLGRVALAGAAEDTAAEDTAAEDAEDADSRAKAAEDAENADSRAKAAEDAKNADSRAKAAEDAKNADTRAKAAEDAEHADHTAAAHAENVDTGARGAENVDGQAGSAEGAEYAQLQPGTRAYARIRLEAPAVLTRGDRFILRQYSPSATIGGGRVIDPLPARSPIRNAIAVERFVRLSGDDDAAAMVFVEERRSAGLTIDALARRVGKTPPEAAEIAARLKAAGQVLDVGGELFPAVLARDLETRLLSAVSEYHKLNPLSGGMPREEARERVFGRASPGLFDAVLGALIAAGKISGRERLAAAGHGLSLTPEESRVQATLDGVFRDAGLAPPDVAAAAASAGIPAGIADRMAKLLLRQKVLVKVDTLLFHHESLDRLKLDVRALKEQGNAARVDVAAFKERYGISRKYAIPLLEWLDRERVTRRMGDARVIL